MSEQEVVVILHVGEESARWDTAIQMIQNGILMGLLGGEDKFPHTTSLPGKF